MRIEQKLHARSKSSKMSSGKSASKLSGTRKLAFAKAERPGLCHLAVEDSY